MHINRNLWGGGRLNDRHWLLVSRLGEFKDNAGKYLFSSKSKDAAVLNNNCFKKSQRGLNYSATIFNN